jgi:hypoxanthine-DNA glycosylase
MATTNHKPQTTNTVIEIHPFKPFIPKNAKYLIIGSFPGKGQTEKSISETAWFYGAKRNTFWKIIEEVYQRELKTTSAKQKLFNDLEMGIADIILKAIRTANTNSDDNLQVIEYNDKAIKKILVTNKIETIFFTSQFVFKIFKRLFPAVINTVVLPSPSPRYAKMSVAEKINIYKKLLPGLLEV